MTSKAQPRKGDQGCEDSAIFFSRFPPADGTAALWKSEISRACLRLRLKVFGVPFDAHILRFTV
jgi:hypothetical protein